MNLIYVANAHIRKVKSPKVIGLTSEDLKIRIVDVLAWLLVLSSSCLLNNVEFKWFGYLSKQVVQDLWSKHGSVSARTSGQGTNTDELKQLEICIS